MQQWSSHTDKTKQIFKESFFKWDYYNYFKNGETEKQERSENLLKGKPQVRMNLQVIDTYLTNNINRFQISRPTVLHF